MERNFPKLPRFAREWFYAGRTRCERCNQAIFENDVTFVGAGRHKNGKVGFVVTAVCKDCKHATPITESDHVFNEPNWWDEIGRWHRRSLELLGPYEQDRTYQGYAKIIVGPPPLRSYTVFGGYRGDVGPILLWIQAFDVFTGLHNNGYGSVRLEREARIRPLSQMESPENLSWTRWYQFQRYPEGTRFSHGGQEWTKMSRAEIAEVLRDRVFTVVPAEVAILSTSKRPKRGSRAKSLSKATKRQRGRPDP